MKHYNQGVILVVSNPVDILTYMISKWSGLPSGKVFGSGTVLDSARFRYVISKKLGVDVRNVHGYIIGEHGDSQLPFWSATHVAGKRLEDSSIFNDAAKEEIMKEVKFAGAEIIKNKGATYYAIAITINRILESILKDQNTIQTVECVIDDYHGIKDISLSLPFVVNRGGVKELFDITPTEAELVLLKHSADQIRAVLEEVKNI